MYDAHSLFEALASNAYECLGGSLEPRGGHECTLMPNGAKSFPIARVAPQDPVLNHLADGELFKHHLIHDTPFDVNLDVRQLFKGLCRAKNNITHPAIRRRAARGAVGAGSPPASFAMGDIGDSERFMNAKIDGVS